MTHRFKVGDRVTLVNPNTERGEHGIPARYWGREYEVKELYAYDRNYGIVGHGKRWGVWEDMLGPAAPLSPFEQSVRAYISQELNP